MPAQAQVLNQKRKISLLHALSRYALDSAKKIIINNHPRSNLPAVIPVKIAFILNQ
jgi:hypothetical protein